MTSPMNYCEVQQKKDWTLINEKGKCEALEFFSIKLKIKYIVLLTVKYFKVYLFNSETFHKVILIFT